MTCTRIAALVYAAQLESANGLLRRGYMPLPAIIGMPGAELSGLMRVAPSRNSPSPEKSKPIFESLIMVQASSW